MHFRHLRIFHTQKKTKTNKLRNKKKRYEPFTENVQCLRILGSEVIH